nr:DUF6538 domain-containing protein [Mesorhizobium sp. SP-1A]
MRHYRKVDPDRYLLTRRGIYYCWRRIPAVVASLDSRSPLVRISLKTDDLAEARAKRDRLEAADNDYWQSLILEEDEAKARLQYDAAVRRAEALGFAYRTSSELASGSLADLVRHVLAIPPAGASPEVEAAVLGCEDRPRDSWWEAYEIYKNEIKKEELAKKSPGQLKRWDNTRKAAISNFLKLVREKPIADTTRKDGMALHKHWFGRVVPDDRTKKRYSRGDAGRMYGPFKPSPCIPQGAPYLPGRAGWLAQRKQLPPRIRQSGGYRQDNGPRRITAYPSARSGPVADRLVPGWTQPIAALR